MKLEKFEKKLTKIIADTVYSEYNSFEDRFMDSKGRLAILRDDSETILTKKYVYTYFGSTGKVTKEKRW